MDGGQCLGDLILEIMVTVGVYISSTMLTVGDIIWLTVGWLQ